MNAFVRVSGPPNRNYLVGYPGISATLVPIPFPLLLILDCPTIPPSLLPFESPYLPGGRLRISIQGS